MVQKDPVILDRALELAVKASGPTTPGAAEDAQLIRRASIFEKFLRGDNSKSQTATSDQ